MLFKKKTEIYESNNREEWKRAKMVLRRRWAAAVPKSISAGSVEIMTRKPIISA